MGKPINLFSRTTGVNSADKTSQLLVNFDSGMSELATASNIDVSDSGVPKTRKGTTLVSNGNVTALCSAGDFCVGQIDGDAVFINSAFNISTLIADIVGHLSLAAMDGRIYFCSTTSQRGYVELDGILRSWEYTTTYTGDNVELTGPPNGVTSMGHYLGKLYVAVETAVYFSLPYAPNVFSLAVDYIDFGSPVLEVFGAPTGLYAISEEGLYAHTGSGNEMQQVKLLGADAAIPGTFVPVKAFGPSRLDGVLLTTINGVVFISGSSMDNIGQDKINFVAGSHGAAYATKTHYYSATR